MEAEHVIKVGVIFQTRAGMVPGPVSIKLRPMKNHVAFLGMPVVVVITVGMANVGAADKSSLGAESGGNILIFQVVEEALAFAEDGALMVAAERIRSAIGVIEG